MKYTFVFCFIASMLMSTASFSQKVTLNISKEPLSKVFAAIEKQTGLVVVYNDQFVKTTSLTTLNVKDIPLEKALSMLLSPFSLSFRITESNIVITRPAAVKKVQATERPADGKRLITGHITDETGNAINDVTINAKGFSVVTKSGVDGSYSFEIPPGAGILIFSHIGYKTLEYAIGSQNALDVVMPIEATSMEEIVSIGYGTSRKKDLTGSVGSLSGSTIQDIPVTSPAEAMTGRIAGVQVTRSEGSPDAEIKIRVRGGGSLTQDNSPLYVVDGFPVDDINNIAPTDIASIDVLKDASSTSIYGARGANGVVLITTKTGADKKGTITYNNYFGIKKITKTIDVLNPYEFVYWQYELDQSTTFEKYYGSYRDIDLYKQMTGTNWQDEIFGRTGSNSFHNLAFSGGSKGSKYSVSLTRNDSKEIMLGSGFSRTNLNARTTSKVNDWLSVDLNTMISDNATKGAGTSSNSRLPHAVQYRPVPGLSEFIDDDLAESGDFDASVSYNKNPVKQTNDDYRRSKSLSINANGALNIKLSKSLKYRFEYGKMYRESTNQNFYGINTSNVLEYGGVPMTRIAKLSMNSQRLTNVLTYTRRNLFLADNFTVALGQELVGYKTQSIVNVSKYFPKYIDPVSALSMMQLGTPDPTITSDDPDNKLSSFFGRLNYSLQDKYLLTTTLRADGSSKFAKGHQWGYFPSVAVAWRLNEENFLSSQQWLSDLKLRVSYGQSGNNRISDNAWRKTFSVLTDDLFLSGSETATPFLAPNSVLSNPELKWETTESRNLGLDFGFFNQRISGTVEVYKNITKDLLISATIPSSTGYTTQWQNIGQTSNRGLELTLNGKIIDKREFTLSASFNIGFNKNRIDKLGDTKQWEETSMWYGWIGTGTVTGDYLIKEGGQIGQMYGYVTDGMYTVNDFDYDPATQKYTLKPGIATDAALINTVRFGPGAMKLRDMNGDTVINASDKVVIGNANPKHTGGFNLTATYKGLDFSAFFNWVYGNDIYNANKLFFTSQPFAYKYRNLYSVMNSDNRFTYINKETGQVVTDPTTLAEMNKNATLWSPAMNNLQLTDWGIENGSFLRLNTVTLGYSLPPKFIHRFKISQFRLFATAYNLWTWTSYSGYDPEVDVVQRTPLTPGIDWSAYPRSRSYNVGLNVTF